MTSPGRDVRPERQGWRDEGISLRHRQWGYDVPATDVDFLLVEYDRLRPVALVEYKCETSPYVSPSHPTMRVLATLGTMAGLPAICCRYARDYTWWWPTPLNGAAERRMPLSKVMTELEYVRFLYELRGRPLPPELESTRDLSR